MSADTKLPLNVFAAWLAQGERGISSEAIVSQLTGLQVGRRRHYSDDYPHDPSDFRRCEMMLRQVPIARLVFASAMPSRSPVWAALVGAWDELVALGEEEVPGAFSDSPQGTSAPRLYARMKELQVAGES